MIADAVTVSENDMRKLLGAASPEAALLYLYVQAGNDPSLAEGALSLSAGRVSCAAATLRQLGLWPEERPIRVAPGERPDYTERDVLSAMDSDNSFRALYGEVQRLLGRSLNTEELKILLGFVRYLNLPAEVIQMLICYCKERARKRGSSRNPSLRTIEKEAYAWAERGFGLYPGPECPGLPAGPAHAGPADTGQKSDPGRGALCPELAGDGL